MNILEEIYEEVSKPTPTTPTEVHTELPLPDKSFEDYLEMGAIIYRSHYNKDVAVVLTEEEQEVKKYLDVKIQVPTKFVYSSHSKLRIKLDNLSLGYRVEGRFQSGRLKNQLMRGNIDIEKSYTSGS